MGRESPSHLAYWHRLVFHKLSFSHLRPTRTTLAPGFAAPSAEPTVCPAGRAALPHAVQQSCWCRPWGAPAEPSHCKSHEADWRKLQGSHCLTDCRIPHRSHPQNKAMSTRALFIPLGRVEALSSEPLPGCCSPEPSGGSLGSLWLKGQPPVLALHPYFSPQAFPPRYPRLGMWQQLSQGGRATADKVRTVPGT